MSSCLTFRRGTSAQWVLSNPTLDAGEMGIETDTLLIKVGDGTTSWSGLPYAANGSSGVAALIPTEVSFQGVFCDNPILPHSGLIRIFASSKGLLLKHTETGSGPIGSDPLWWGATSYLGPSTMTTPFATIITGTNVLQAGVTGFGQGSPLFTQGCRKLTSTNSTTTSVSVYWGSSGNRPCHFNLPFYAHSTIAAQDVVTTKTLFVGVSNNTTWSGSTNPTTLTQSVGLVAASGDATLSILSSNASAQTLVPLGERFPKPELSNGAAYTLELWGRGDPTQIFWGVTRLDTVPMHYASGVITSTYPTNTLPLTHMAFMGYSGGSAQVLQGFFGTQYWEFNLP